LRTRGNLCLLIGYPKDHYHDTFRLFKLDTRKVVESRDFMWLNKMYREEGEESNLVAVVSDPNDLRQDLPSSLEPQGFDRKGWLEISNPS
jgi:hypothetical protein